MAHGLCRSERINVRFRPHERALLDQAARAQRERPAEFARSAVIARARRVLSDAPSQELALTFCYGEDRDERQ